MKIGRLAIATFAVCGYLFAQQSKPSLPRGLPPIGSVNWVHTAPAEEHILLNGMRIWLVQRHDLPKVAFRLRVLGGNTIDPAGAPGLTQALAVTVNQGTATRSAKDIAEAAESAGGDLSVSVDPDSIEMSINALSESADTVAALLADIAQNAAFPNADVALAKSNLENHVKGEETTPRFLGRQALFRLLYRDHPYQTLAPSQSTIENATVEALKSLYHRAFRPDRALLVVVGDFEPAGLLTQVTKNFGPWKASGPEPTLTAPPERKPNHKIYIVERPGSVQSTIMLGQFGPTLGDPEEPSLAVANAIYGEDFSSRLTKNLREDKGYTYHPFSSVLTLRLSGMITTGADVRNQVTGPTLKEILFELHRMATTEPSADEVESAKQYLVGNTAIDLHPNAALAATLASFWAQGKPSGFIDSRMAKVERVTAAEVQDAATKFLDPAQMTIVVVGDKDVLDQQLSSFGIDIASAPAVH